MSRIAEEIKERVTIPDALNHYGYKAGRGNRIPCPIHNGKDPNFAFTEHVYHCWTCGAKGDVIRLVEELFDLNFQQAIMKMNADFRLGLSAKKPTLRERRIMAEEKQWDRIMEEEKREKEQIYHCAGTMCQFLWKLFCEGKSDANMDSLRLEFEKWLDDNSKKVVTPCPGR